MGSPPEFDENLRSALWINEGPFGEDEVNGLDSSFFSSSLSFGEYAAPKGLWASRGEVALGLAGLPFRLDCEGGVEPDENLELKLEIQEFLRPPTGLGVLRCVAGDGVDGVCCSAVLFSFGSAFSSTLPRSFWVSFFGSGVLDVGRAGLLLERDLRCDLDGVAVASSSEPDRSHAEVTDFVRWR